MSGPRRLKDEPELRAALRDEELLVGPYDLDRVRRAVAARTGGGPPGGGGAVAGGVVAAGLGIAALALLAVSGEVTDHAEVAAPVEVVRVEEAPPPVAPEAPPREEPAEVEPVEVAAEIAPAAPAVEPAGADPVVAEATPPAPEPEPAAVEPPPEPVGIAAVEPDDHDAVALVDEPPPRGTLGAELAAVRAARAALDAGDPGAALAGYRDYLARWPDGHLRQEALAAVLEALVALERWDAVAPLAGRLADTPELAPRRAEMLRTRADALARLDRCDEALELARALARPEAAAIRQRCRKAP